MAKKKLVIPNSKDIPVKNSPVSDSQLPPYYKEGAKRPYYTTELDQSFVQKSTLTKNDKIIISVLFIVSIIGKFQGLSEPNSIIFDEIHTVKHINKYIDGVFFNDVTPPLSQLFYTLIAFISGYNGDAYQLSKAGESYFGTSFPYTTLRFFTILIGSANLPVLFLTLRFSGVRTYIAGATSTLLLLENMIVLHSRIFMPDTLTLFSISLAVYSYKRLDINEPFSANWFRFLLSTGIALGFAVSAKLIGLATIFWVLSLSAIKIWYLLGDVKVSDCKIVKQIASRSVAFIVIPFLIYFFTFFIHLSLLRNYHKDASLYSPDFQRTLDFNDIDSIPKYVTYGSTVTIRHSDSIGGYLHSHPYAYKSGSKNQQVTVFDFKDFNNEWVIEPTKHYDVEDPRIRSNGEFRLRHKITGQLLRVSDSKPPISEQEYDFEVSCFGNSSYNGEQTDQYWIKFDAPEDQPYLTAFNTQFQLQNVKKRCWILSHDLKLPEWGFNQQEVICINSPTVSRSLFYIETVKYPQEFTFNETSIFNEEVPTKKLWFFSKFIEVNRKMIRLFRNIKSRNINVSNPTSWPFLIKGVKYSTRPQSTLYVIGNPIVFWLVVVLIPSYIIIQGSALFRTDYVKESIQYKDQAFTFVLGWLVHLLPYALNEGEWFIHYYIPSLYFGILLIGVTFEFIFFKNKNIGYAVIGTSLVLAYYFYSSLSPLAFASQWTEAACESARLFPSWDFRCDAYIQKD